jgi:RNA polymerase sigma-70 factor (ECF subfamily)
LEASKFVSSTESEGRQGSASIGGLYHELAPELRAFLLGLLKDHHLADEALQVTFTKAIDQQHTIHNTNPRGWLFQVAYHEAMFLRRQQGVEGRGLRGLAWLKGDTVASPDDPLIREEVAQRVRESLNALPVEQREVVHRRIHHNQTFAQIAAELGLPLGTVLTRMRLALHKLQQKLTDLE